MALISVLIATPMYGGQCTEEYFVSSLALQHALIHHGIDCNWLTIANESLITRARNSAVATFLQTDYSHLMFIDADIKYTPEDFLALWEMGKPLAVGCYRMKKEGAPYAAWVAGALVENFANLPNPVSVDYAGTGFMLINRGVLTKMMTRYPQTKHVDGYGESHALFDCTLEDGTYLPEDYTFCKRWRAIGGHVWMNTEVRLGHVGRYLYQ